MHPFSCFLRRPLRRVFLLLPAILTLLVGAGCNRPAAPEAPGIEDERGRPVALPDTLARIVALGPSVTEVLCAAGAAELLVGVSTVDDYPPAVVEALPRFNLLPIDYEAILRLRPDMAFASDQIIKSEDAEKLERLGVPVYFLTSQSPEEVFASMARVGALLGRGPEAAAAADSLRGRLEALRRLTAEQAARPSVLVLIGDEALYAFGRESYVHALIADAGGVSATGGIATERPVLSEEFVLEARPDVIVGAFGKDYDPARLLRSHPAFRATPAVRNGRVYSMEASVLLRPGPRLVEAAWHIGRLLHPDAVGGAPAARP